MHFRRLLCFFQGFRDPPYHCLLHACDHIKISLITSEDKNFPRRMIRAIYSLNMYCLWTLLNLRDVINWNASWGLISTVTWQSSRNVVSTYTCAIYGLHILCMFRRSYICVWKHCSAGHRWTFGVLGTERIEWALIIFSLISFLRDVLLEN